MGQPYAILEHKFLDLLCNKDTDIVVEIGSGYSEGSTEFLFNWAESKQLPFYTIDISPLSQYKLRHLGANFVIQSGSRWCKEVLPGLDKKIKILYLDNFDFPWDNLPTALLEKQIQYYQQQGTELTAENSMREHRLQTEYCLPFMAEESIILMDDTCYNPMLVNQRNDELLYWEGKCATAMPLMIEAGFEIIRDQEYNINYATRQLNRQAE